MTRHRTRSAGRYKPAKGPWTTAPRCVAMVKGPGGRFMDQCREPRIGDTVYCDRHQPIRLEDDDD